MNKINVAREKKMDVGHSSFALCMFFCCLHFAFLLIFGKSHFFPLGGRATDGTGGLHLQSQRNKYLIH